MEMRKIGFGHLEEVVEMGLFSFLRNPKKKPTDEEHIDLTDRVTRLVSLATSNVPNYDLLELKVKHDCYLDRLIVVKTLVGDRNPRSVAILEWLLYNGKDRSRDGVRVDERGIAAEALARTGGEYALRALIRAVGTADIQFDIHRAIAEIRRQVLAENAQKNSKDALRSAESAKSVYA